MTLLRPCHGSKANWVDISKVMGAKLSEYYCHVKGGEKLSQNTYCKIITSWQANSDYSQFCNASVTD